MAVQNFGSGGGGYQVSPGINISEIDLTTVVPPTSTTVGAIAGVFRWGPIGVRSLVTSENDLVRKFGKPSSINPETFFTAASFLGYSNALYVSRAANTATVFSAIANVSAFSAAASHSVMNADDYDTKVGAFDPAVDFIAKYPGALGNSLKVSVCDSVNAYSSAVDFAGNATFRNTALTLAVGSNTASVLVSNTTGVGATSLQANTEATRLAALLTAGDIVEVGNSSIGKQSLKITSVGSVTGQVDFTANTTTASSNATAFTYLLDNSGGSVVAGADVTITGYSATGYNVSAATVATANATAFTVANTTATSNLATTAAAANTTALIYSVTNTSNTVVAGDTITVTGYANANFNVTSATVVTANTTAISVASVADPDDEATAGVLTYRGLVTEVGTTGTAAFSDSQVSFNISFDQPLKIASAVSANAVTRYWEYYNQVDSAPGTSLFQSQTTTGNTSAVDEVHVVVVDEDGGFTGSPGSVLEVYKGLSRAEDAKSSDGSTNYYKNVLNEQSQYIWWASQNANAPVALASALVSSTNSKPTTLSFQGGVDNDESTIPFADTARAYDLFASAEEVDISLLLTGSTQGGTNGSQQANYLIDNIAEVRKDCVVFVSPQKADVVNQTTAAAQNIVDFRNSVRSSSFAVMDSGYKYMYDKYNDINRWVPLNGDIAGLCVVTDNSRDPWYSPAGTNRGQIRNSIKLAFNPAKAERDLLYKNGINPVISSPGEGTILFGDKTLLAKPSAFDRINVRRLFIVLEKSIARAAKSLMFEFNDEFTRTQFRNLVEPFLRDVQGRRGITDFKVVCDGTNNTAEVIDSNRFVGDIYVKPARSINFIQLNFVAVRSGIEFSEIVG
jgi:hypothetical protein